MVVMSGHGKCRTRHDLVPFFEKLVHGNKRLPVSLPSWRRGFDSHLALKKEKLATAGFSFFNLRQRGVERVRAPSDSEDEQPWMAA